MRWTSSCGAAGLVFMGLMGASVGFVACEEDQPVIPPCRMGEACSRSSDMFTFTPTDACVPFLLVDGHPETPGLQPDCVVRERSGDADAGAQETPVPPCTEGGPQPCWTVVQDATCTVAGVRFELRRPGDPPPGSAGVAICSTCPPPIKDVPPPRGCPGAATF